jgi:1,4-alpha-glucan branching enzyme
MPKIKGSHNQDRGKKGVIGKEQVAANGQVRVIFRLPSTTCADRISVVGEFNDWDTTATPMKHLRSDAEWTASVVLQAGQRYRFRYLLDGREWLNDWYADDHEDNAYGSRDSVVDLSEFGTPPWT